MLSKKSKYIVLAAVLLLGLSQVAFAKLVAVGPVLPDTDPGPGWSPGYNGYPSWYRDSLGQTAAFRSPPYPGTIFDPPDPTVPFSVQTGFGAEGFYWDANATIADLGGGNQALLVLALELAYNTADPTDGEQITFARIRIRVDTPVAGTYRIIHPYGEKVFTNVPAGGRQINDTSDVGIGAPGNFTGALAGQIDPLLKMVNPPPPAGFLGDAATPATVTGSPTGNNLFRVERLVNGVFVQVGQTDQFIVSGRLYPRTPIIADRATYSQDPAGVTTVSGFAQSFPPEVPGETITVTGNAGAGNFNLARSGFFFFGSQVLPDGTEPPATLRFVGRTNGVNLTFLDEPLTDLVAIKQADWSAAAQTLTILVESSDAFAPLPTLTLSGRSIPDTQVSAGTVVVAGVISPPPVISVTSSAGGLDSASVVILP